MPVKHSKNSISLRVGQLMRRINYLRGMARVRPHPLLPRWYEAGMILCAALLAAFILWPRDFVPGVTTEDGGAQPRPEWITEDGLIDLNSVPVDMLELLPGIGPVRAAAIVAYREECGGFSNKYQLLAVDELGKAGFEQITDYICVEEADENTGS